MRSKSFFSSFVRCSSVLFIGLALIIIGAWIIAIPESAIKEFVENSLNNGRFHVGINGLKKGMFYNLSADTVTLRNNDAEIIRLENVSLRIKPAYLFLLRLKSSLAGDCGGGNVSGSIGVGRDLKFADLVFENVDIKNIPYLGEAGIKGAGLIKASVRVENTHVRVRFSVDNAKLENSTLLGVSLPLEMFDRAKGQLEVSGNEVIIDSFSLEGRDIYGRIKGVIRDNIADLTVEIMPEISAADKLPALMFMERYKISPGYYLIPIKTNLSSIISS